MFNKTIIAPQSRKSACDRSKRMNSLEGSPISSDLPPADRQMARQMIDVLNRVTADLRALELAHAEQKAASIIDDLLSFLGCSSYSDLDK